MLRIQQDEVITHIVEKAIQILVEEKAAVATFPTKFLVPFLEKASLEDSQSDLLETWATLLASAATNSIITW